MSLLYPYPKNSREVTFPRKSHFLGRNIFREVTYPGKSQFLGSHISREATFPGKSHFPGSHISREVTFSGKSHFLGSYLIIIFLPKVSLIQAKIGIIWSFSTKYHQQPNVPQREPKIGIRWSFPQKHHHLPQVPKMSKYPQNTLHISQNDNETNDETDVRTPTLFSSTRPDSS